MDFFLFSSWRKRLEKGRTETEKISENLNHVCSHFAYLYQGKSAVLECDFRG